MLPLAHDVVKFLQSSRSPESIFVISKAIAPVYKLFKFNMVHSPATSTSINNLSTTIFSRHVKRVSTYVTITQALQCLCQYLEQHSKRTFRLNDHLEVPIYQPRLRSLVVRPWNRSGHVCRPHRNMFSGFRPGSSR